MGTAVSRVPGRCCFLIVMSRGQYRSVTSSRRNPHLTRTRAEKSRTPNLIPAAVSAAGNDRRSRDIPFPILKVKTRPDIHPDGLCANGLATQSFLRDGFMPLFRSGDLFVPEDSFSQVVV